MSAHCLVADLGTVEYAAAFELQTRLVDARREDRVPDVLLFVEHPPTITLGRSADEENLLADAAALDAAGVAVHESNRGGDITYHGPGQLVGYPLLQLTGERRDIHAYIRSLESVLIAALDTFGVHAGRVQGLTGVWVGDEKVAAIGVAIRHWITMHGFALNVAPDLRHFELIRPCGIADLGVTSMAKLLGEAPVQAMVRDAVAEAFSDEFALAPQWVAREDLFAEIGIEPIHDSQPTRGETALP